jgi:hypothetical protein
MSSGLDIVPKNLGRHEIATVQMTGTAYVTTCNCIAIDIYPRPADDPKRDLPLSNRDTIYKTKPISFGWPSMTC